MSDRTFQTAPIDEYELGNVPRLYTVGPFEVDGNPTDPDEVWVTVVRPGADPYTRTFVYGTDAELVKDGPGDFHLEFEPHLTGLWIYQYTGVGAAHATATWRFRVWSPLATALP